MKKTIKKIFDMTDRPAPEQEPETPQNEPQTDDLSKKTAVLEAQLAETKDKYLRLAAEFENYKRRTAREALEVRQTAGREILSALLPILDDLDRAANTGNGLSEGVSLIFHKLQLTLAQRGLVAMDTNGKDFDPDNHEAVAEIPAPTEALCGKVIDTLEKGYLLNGARIRFAKVVVGK